jgi:hypothetical protein
MRKFQGGEEQQYVHSYILAMYRTRQGLKTGCARATALFPCALHCSALHWHVQSA